MSQTNQTKNIYKVILVGEGGVGKTELIRKRLGEKFESKYLYPTLGAELDPISVNFCEGKTVQTYIFNCWNFSENGEQEYFTGANACIVMFDLTNVKTLASLQKWVDNVNKKCGNIPIILCGNKVDCKDRKIESSSIRNDKKLSNYDYFEISVKTGQNVDELFTHLLNKLR